MFTRARTLFAGVAMKNDEIIPAPFSPSDANYPSNSAAVAAAGAEADRDPERCRRRQIELFHPCMNTFDTVLGREGGWGLGRQMKILSYMLESQKSFDPLLHFKFVK